MAAPSKGAAGEVAASRYLRERGYTPVATNYRCRFGEIDLIVRDKKYFVFVEVKCRQPDARYAPRDAVTVTKQRKILATASLYLATHPTALQPRFDVVEVVAWAHDPLHPIEINHIPGAFEAGDLHAAF